MLFIGSYGGQISESMKALNDTDSYEDTSDYQSVESIHNNNGYYDHSPTEFYPMIPEQKYRPPLDNICRSMYTKFVCPLISKENSILMLNYILLFTKLNFSYFAL